MALPTGSATGNVMPAPSVSLVPAIGTGWDANFTTDEEILYSTVGYTQKGVTLKPGVGILAAGTILGRVTATKLWTAYSDGASDGTEVARGALRQRADTGSAGTTARLIANIVIRGILKLAKLSGLDGNAIVDLNGRSDTVLGTFTF